MNNNERIFKYENELINEEQTTKVDDYWNGKTSNEFIRWLGNQHDPKEVSKRARLLIPKWPLLHPNKYSKYWCGSQEEIKRDEDGYYELIPFRQLDQIEGNDKFNYILLNAGDMYIPIRLYSRGGAEVDPAYRTEFNRRFSNEERHFIMGCIIYNNLVISDANIDYGVGYAQLAISRYRDNMSPKRLRTGDIRLYDSKTRRKIKAESTGPYTQKAINTNTTFNSFEYNLKMQYERINKE